TKSHVLQGSHSPPAFYISVRAGAETSLRNQDHTHAATFPRYFPRPALFLLPSPPQSLLAILNTACRRHLHG
uniref:Uncharacterized protein n=1 Tax=Aegilops tauschii subsp. strangulata TaxID=200361 RepID=A0A453G8B9_AEGTS